MITPADIQNKEFSKEVRGFDKEEVNMFLDLITLDLEKLMKENLNLKAQIATLSNEKDSIGGSDITMKETLEAAKKLMDDLTVSSEKRAKTLLENAEMDAAIILKDAKMKAEQIDDEAAQILKSFSSFKKDYKEMLDRFKSNFEDSISTAEIDRLGAMINKRNKEKAEKVAFENMTVGEILEKDSIEDFDLGLNTENNEEDKKSTVDIRQE